MNIGYPNAKTGCTVTAIAVGRSVLLFASEEEFEAYLVIEGMRDEYNASSIAIHFRPEPPVPLLDFGPTRGRQQPKPFDRPRRKGRR